MKFSLEKSLNYPYWWRNYRWYPYSWKNPMYILYYFLRGEKPTMFRGYFQIRMWEMREKLVDKLFRVKYSVPDRIMYETIIFDKNH